jgi:hypothetical protein
MALLSLHGKGEALGDISEAGLTNDLAASGELELLDVDAIDRLEASLGRSGDGVLVVDAAFDSEALHKKGILD